MPATIPEMVPGTRFKIEYHPDGERLHLEERVGFAFSCHARAALFVAEATGREVFWVHSPDIEVSTANGRTPEALLAYYKNRLPEK
jgi:hypothetical protein